MTGSTTEFVPARLHNHEYDLNFRSSAQRLFGVHVVLVDNRDSIGTLAIENLRVVRAAVLTA